MLKKKCPSCNNYSYSADKRKWQCPHCCRSLNDVEAEPASENYGEDNKSLSKASQNKSSVLEKYLNQNKNKKGEDEDA